MNIKINFKNQVFNKLKGNLILLVDEEFMVCPTTSIVKISKVRGTSVY